MYGRGSICIQRVISHLTACCTPGHAKPARHTGPCRTRHPGSTAATIQYSYSYEYSAAAAAAASPMHCLFASSSFVFPAVRATFESSRLAPIAFAPSLRPALTAGWATPSGRHVRGRDPERSVWQRHYNSLSSRLLTPRSSPCPACCPALVLLAGWSSPPQRAPRGGECRVTPRRH